MEQRIFAPFEAKKDFDYLAYSKLLDRIMAEAIKTNSHKILAFQQPKLEELP